MAVFSLSLVLCVVSAAPLCSASEGTIVVGLGRLVVGTGEVVENATVVVEGDRIASVHTGKVDIPAGVEVIDLSRYTGIPGLIDAHTHMTYYWDQTPGTNPWAQLENMSPPVAVFLAQENARKTLETGVTTVRDLGAFDPHACVYMDMAMRDLIDRGAMVGPRMYVCGYGLLATFVPSRPGYTVPSWGQADGVPDVIRVVREQLAAGADWIKMFASTGTGDDVSGHQTFTFEEIEAAVEVTQSLGKRIAVHSYGPDAARDAVRAGADSIEHATGMDDATIGEMARKGIFYVPTVDHNRYYVEHRDEYGYGPDIKKRLYEYIEKNVDTVRRAHRAGVRIAMGSDAVFTMFGQNTRELGWFVRAGMTPEQALATATTNGAALLGVEHELGAVAPGYLADLVAVDGDPLADIDVVINNVRWVMKAGKVVVDSTEE
jgi:imidazolonepropionase-like amidohydrolase